jgi:hypothetical protein
MGRPFRAVEIRDETTLAVVAERRLRYSERKRIAETGSLSDLSDTPTAPLKMAMFHALERACNECNDYIEAAFKRKLQEKCREHFGWPPHVGALKFAAETADVEDLLDYLEILVDVGMRNFTYYFGQHQRSATPWARVEDDLNKLFDRHRFGYRIKEGEIHSITSPALEETVVGPALLAARRPGWEQVEKSFREALLHQRGSTDENDDAITSANAALEAALKAAGLPGNTIGDLAKSFRKASWAAPQIGKVPDAIDMLLKTSGAVRNIHGDAHGKDAGADEVPQALVDLTINLVGSLIVYLAEAAP